MGNGYAWLAAAQLLVDSPDADLKFFNRGISGNKVYQLAERWQADCLDIKPDVLSILIGVNDFWHKHKHGYEGTLEKYENRLPRAHQAHQRRAAEREARHLRAVRPEGRRGRRHLVRRFDGYRAAAKRVADEAGADVRAVPNDVRRRRQNCQPPTGPPTASIPRPTAPR